MKRFTRTFRPTLRLFVLAATAIFLTSSLALGQPITYTGFIITDGQLGNWSFHNARVILTFESDTNYVQQLDPACGTSAAFNSTGVARITIVDHERVVRAKFDPHQIFVSFDQTFGGVGFGSFGPGFTAPDCSNPASLQPAYPLGLHHGTMDNTGDESPIEATFPNDLQGDVGFSGKGYTCVGVPQLECDPPTAALKTDHGDLFLFEPYQDYRNEFLVSLNGAFFFQQTGRRGSPLPRAVLAPSGSAAKGSITYHLLLVSDVSLNGELFENATIHLSFQSDTSRVTDLEGGGPGSAMNAHGVARVEIRKGVRTESATFARHQIYVYFNSLPISAGFASYAGGPMYPAALAPTFVHNDVELLEEATTDLKSETLLAEYVSSCTSFDFTNGFCSDLTSQPRLVTDKGDFYLYEPYNANGFQDPTTEVRSSNGWGVFWTTFGGGEHED
jgi:hypothetical protein